MGNTVPVKLQGWLVPRYSEDTLVQQTTAENLERQLGWELVYAYNTETFGVRALEWFPVSRSRKDSLVDLHGLEPCWLTHEWRAV